MPKRDMQSETVEQSAAPTTPAPAEAPTPEPTPAAGGRYRRRPDGSLEPITDEE